MVHGLLLLLLPLLPLPALAQADTPAPPFEKCEDAPYLAETPDGVVGGVNVEYDGSVAVFSDGACFASRGIQLWAREIRFDQATGEVRLEAFTAQTRTYRFRARTGVVRERLFRARGIGLTTCKCGEDLRLVAEEAHFDTESGLLVLADSELAVYGLELAHFDQLRLAIDQPVAEAIPGLPSTGGTGSGGGTVLNVPLRFGYSFSDGLTLGFEDLPLPPRAGETASSTLTLLVSNLSNPETRTLTLGAAVADAGGSVRFRTVLRHRWFDLEARLESGPFFLTGDTNRDEAVAAGARYSLFELGWRDTFALEGARLSPFVRLAEEQTVSDDNPQAHSPGDAYVGGLTVGAELRYPFELKEGPAAFRLEPWVLGAVYTHDSPYVAAGLRLEGGYSEGFSWRIAYEYSLQNRPSAYRYERREPTSRFAGELGYADLTAHASFDFLDRELGASLRYAPKLPDGVLTAEFRYRNDLDAPPGDAFAQQRELVVDFNPNPIACTFSFAAAPTLGFDFLRGGMSRAGLELRYADCCFVWKVGYQHVFLSQTGEAATGRFTFGLELR